MAIDNNDDFRSESNGSFLVHGDNDESGPFNLEEEQPATVDAFSEEHKKLQQKENQADMCLRVVIYSLLIFTAIIVSLGVYFFAKNEEENEFEAQFEANARKVIEAFHDSVEQKMGAIDTLAVSITAYALDRNKTFPFVTLPYFQNKGANTRIAADAVIIHWLPLVTDANRAAWEEYALLNRFQIDEACAADASLREMQDKEFGYTTSRNLQQQAENDNVLDDGTGYHLRIWSNGTGKQPDPEGSGPFFPMWQRSPINDQKQSSLNRNLAATRALEAIRSVVLETQKVAINQVEISSLDENLKISQYRHNVDEYQGDPVSYMAYPVFDRFTNDREMVGILATNLYWRLFFTDILPSTANGVICVLHNSYDQVFSFRLDGSQVTFLGPGDQHDPKYEDMVHSAFVNSHVQSRATPETRAYTAVPLETEFGRYTISVYPSQATGEQYMTNLPIFSTILVACVFIFTSVVFFVHDWLVEQRKKAVMSQAIKSSAIVASLFPTSVKERLYDHAEEESKAKTFKSDKQFGDIFSKSTTATGGEGKLCRPIADKFPETSVFFADIAGFTKWSASHEPDEVFELLETIYGAFDAIAVRRKVFKVETIGDCYMAVTGLPEPQIDHGLIMVRFARDCLHIMNSILLQLSETLGEHTMDLNMRVGIHSGPVTAGVLRGQKSRFQLFGDTVNTASRMESNGMKGRIHVSQATADELAAHGRSNWLVPREDKIVAKGKGEMQTYWIEFGASDKSISSTGCMEVYDFDRDL